MIKYDSCVDILCMETQQRNLVYNKRPKERTFFFFDQEYKITTTLPGPHQTELHYISLKINVPIVYRYHFFKQYDQVMDGGRILKLGSNKKKRSCLDLLLIKLFDLFGIKQNPFSLAMSLG